MKKQILFAATALMLTAGVVAGSNESEAKAPKKIAINKKNFPDQVFRELVKSNYDKNKDKKLSKGEKAKKFGTSSTKNSIKIKKSKYGKYTKKYIKDIKNFKGIEKLTNLQKFVANETSVKTINLKKNKNLTYLEMQDGNLRKIDLNSNKKLKYVYLAYNKISSLKMNKCKKLLIVNIQGHMVKKVKINRNKATVVYGEDYYAPYAVTKVKENFSNLNKAGQMDGKGCAVSVVDKIMSGKGVRLDYGYNLPTVGNCLKEYEVSSVRRTKILERAELYTSRIIDDLKKGKRKKPFPYCRLSDLLHKGLFNAFFSRSHLNFSLENGWWM